MKTKRVILKARYLEQVKAAMGCEVVAPVKTRYEAAPGIEVCPLADWTAKTLEETR